MDLKSLGDRLLEAGAPVLKSVVQKSAGGVGGVLAGAAIDALADALHADPTPEAITQAIERDPAAAAPAVREVASSSVASACAASAAVSTPISDPSSLTTGAARRWDAPRPAIASRAFCVPGIDDGGGDIRAETVAPRSAGSAGADKSTPRRLSLRV